MMERLVRHQMNSLEIDMHPPPSWHASPTPVDTWAPDVDTWASDEDAPVHEHPAELVEDEAEEGEINDSDQENQPILDYSTYVE